MWRSQIWNCCWTSSVVVQIIFIVLFCLVNNLNKDGQRKMTNSMKWVCFWGPNIQTMSVLPQIRQNLMAHSRQPLQFDSGSWKFCSWNHPPPSLMKVLVLSKVNSDLVIFFPHQGDWKHVSQALSNCWTALAWIGWWRCDFST